MSLDFRTPQFGWHHFILDQLDKYSDRSSPALCLRRKGRRGFFISLMVRVATFRAEALPGGDTDSKTCAGCSSGPVCFGSTCFHKETLALQQKLPLASAAIPSGESLVFTHWLGAVSFGRPICRQAPLVAVKRLHCARAGSCAGVWSAFRTLNVQPVIVCRKPHQLLDVWCDFNYCFVTFECQITWYFIWKSSAAALIWLSSFSTLIANIGWIWYSKKALTGLWCGCQTHLL